VAGFDESVTVAADTGTSISFLVAFESLYLLAFRFQELGYDCTVPNADDCSTYAYAIVEWYDDYDRKNGQSFSIWDSVVGGEVLHKSSMLALLMELTQLSRALTRTQRA